MITLNSATLTAISRLGPFLGAMAIGLLVSCADPKPEITGRWASDQTSLVTLYFYPDGAASLSGTGLLNLTWHPVNDRLIRIDALDKKIICHFKISKDQKGYLGTLELIGFDTLV